MTTQHPFVQVTHVLASPFLEPGSILLHVEEEADDVGRFEFYLLPLRRETAEALRDQLTQVLAPVREP